MKLVKKLALRLALSPKERVVTKICCENMLKSMKKEQEKRELSDVELTAMEKIESSLTVFE